MDYGNLISLDPEITPTLDQNSFRSSFGEQN